MTTASERVARSVAKRLATGARVVKVILNPAEAEALDRLTQGRTVRDTVGAAIMAQAGEPPGTRVAGSAFGGRKTARDRE